MGCTDAWSASRGWREMGAKSGAIRSGFVPTAVDSCGLECPLLRPVGPRVDAGGHRLEIYGSGGWVFESPRARFGISLQ